MMVFKKEGWVKEAKVTIFQNVYSDQCNACESESRFRRKTSSYRLHRGRFAVLPARLLSKLRLHDGYK